MLPSYFSVTTEISKRDTWSRIKFHNQNFKLFKLLENNKPTYTNDKAFNSSVILLKHFPSPYFFLLPGNSIGVQHI